MIQLLSLSHSLSMCVCMLLLGTWNGSPISRFWRFVCHSLRMFFHAEFINTHPCRSKSQFFVCCTGGHTMILFEPSTMQKWLEWMRIYRNLKEARNWRIWSLVNFVGEIEYFLVLFCRYMYAFKLSFFTYLPSEKRPFIYRKQATTNLKMVKMPFKIE